MYSDKYQSLILNDINIIEQCLVFPAKQFMFQHVLTPCHRSASTIAFLTNENVHVLEWPANSPDAIENMWHIMKIKLRDMGTQTSEQMWQPSKTSSTTFPVTYVVD